jgi:hypothetical protein
MTEAEWLAGVEPAPLLEHLEGHVSDRKYRLLVCACCRAIWPWLNDPRSREAVETSERFADGEADAGELEQFRGRAWQAVKDLGLYHPLRIVPEAAAVAARFLSRETGPARWMALAAAAAFLGKPQNERLCGLIRELFGNPFRPPEVHPAWLAWQDGTVPRLARAVYDGRSFADLPLLADALEEAGCTDAALLGHCRVPADHVRGCWALDLLLDKK